MKTLSVLVGDVRLGPYTVSAVGFATMARLARSRWLPTPIVRLASEPDAIAREVLRRNAGAVLRAGSRHYHSMWVADTGVAFAGALATLPRPYLVGLVMRMLGESRARHRVPTCFTSKKVADVPWPRCDGAPWLLRMVEQLGPHFTVEHADACRQIYADWSRANIDPDTGLIAWTVRGDWIDTTRRPSSTYSNLLALHTHRLAARLNWSGGWNLADRCEKNLLASRWHDGRLREDASGDPSLAGDAQALALYLADLPPVSLRKIARTTAASGLTSPIPLRARDRPRDLRLPLAALAGSYHEEAWSHLGWMWCVGLAKLGERDAMSELVLEDTVRKHGTFVEVLGQTGEPLVTRGMRSEIDFTMSAGLYLEWRELVRRDA